MPDAVTVSYKRTGALGEQPPDHAGGEAGAEPLEVPSAGGAAGLVGDPEDHQPLPQHPGQLGVGPAVAAVVPRHLADRGVQQHPAVAVPAVAARLLGDAGPEQLALGTPVEDPMVEQGPVPTRQVTRSREQAAVAAQVPPRSARRPRMLERPALPDPAGVVLDGDVGAAPARQRVTGLRHARRPEQVAGQEPLVAGAGRPLDDHRQQAVADVGVVVRRAGRGAQRGGESPRDQLPPGEPLVVVAERVDQPRGVGEQLLDGDARLVRRDRPEPVADRLVHVEPTEHLELDHRGGGELLGQRADVVDGVAPGRHARGAVGKTEPLTGHDVVAAHRDQGPAGAVRDGAVDEPDDRRRGRVGLGPGRLHLHLDRHVRNGHATDDEQRCHGDTCHHRGAPAYAAHSLEQPAAHQRERLPTYAGPLTELEGQVEQVAAVALALGLRVGEQAPGQPALAHAGLGLRVARTPARDPSAVAMDCIRADLLGQRGLAGRREPVVATAAAVDHVLARLGHQPVVGEPVERAVEGAGGQPDPALGELLDVLGDAVAVQLAHRKAGQDEQRLLGHIAKRYIA